MRIIGGRLKGKTIEPPQGYKARQTTDNECIMDLTVSIDSINQLQKLMKDLRKVDSVFDVRRAR